MFLILLIILILSGISIIFLRKKASDITNLLYFSSILYIGALFIIPFFDPLQLPGFFASVILDIEFPSIYGIIVSIIAINIAIYGIHIFFSSMRLIKAERYKVGLIDIGQFSRRRHPIHASYHLIVLSYLVLMGSVIGVIIISLTIIFLYLDTYRIENNILIPKFEDDYLRYRKRVPKKLYSWDILSLLTILYTLFIFGIIGILFLI